MYLVLQTNFITAQQFKSFEAYNQFVCGWVKDVFNYKVAGKFLTTGRVSFTPHACTFTLSRQASFCHYCRFVILNVWVRLLSVAGSTLRNQERCAVHIATVWQVWERHVHTLLRFYSIWKRLLGCKASKFAHKTDASGLFHLTWETLSNVPVKSIDFRKRKRNLDEAINAVEEHVQVQPICSRDQSFNPDLNAFFNDLSFAGLRPAILSIIPSYCSAYVPKRLLPTFPEPLSFLHKSDMHDNRVSWTIESMWSCWSNSYQRNVKCYRGRNQKSGQLKTLV